MYVGRRCVHNHLRLSKLQGVNVPNYSVCCMNSMGWQVMQFTIKTTFSPICSLSRVSIHVRICLTWTSVQAIDLRSSLDIAGEHGIPPTIGSLFQVCPALCYLGRMFSVPWKYMTKSNKCQLSIEINIMLEVVIGSMWSLRVSIWNLGDTLLICLCSISDLSSCGAEHYVLISSCPRCVPSTWEHIIRHMDHASTEKTETWNYRASLSRQPAELENSMHKIRKPSLNFWDSCYSSGVSHISHYRWHYTRTHQQPVETEWILI